MIGDDGAIHSPGGEPGVRLEQLFDEMLVDALLSRVEDRQVERGEKRPEGIDHQEKEQTRPPSAAEDRQRKRGERHDDVAKILSQIFAVGLGAVVWQGEETNHQHQRVDMNDNSTLDVASGGVNSASRVQISEKQSIVNEQTSSDRHRRCTATVALRLDCRHSESEREEKRTGIYTFSLSLAYASLVKRQRHQHAKETERSCVIIYIHFNRNAFLYQQSLND